jgi:predicted neuraminidase
MRSSFIVGLVGLLLTGCATRQLHSPTLRCLEPAELKNSRIKTAEFIYEQAPFPSCHASTIEETKSGLIAAWFGGTDEKEPDVGIWVSRHENGKWTVPVEVANGIQPGGNRHPCWNPVLFQPKQGPLLLFYKVGPSPSSWWGMLMTSTDQGKTWSQPTKLPDGILGPIRSKPVQLADGTILCGSSTEHAGWKIHFEHTSDLGKTWTRTAAMSDPKEFDAIQPTILVHKNQLQALCRSRQGRITEVWSSDNGHTWSPMKATALPNPSAGVDGVTLRDGRHLLVYNHTPRGRSPLNVAVSSDGKDWQPLVTLESEPGEYSYPAMIQTRDGLVHITYTWKRQRIKHVVLDASR